jgi:SPX domain protein involved in polyphosphate accumulation
MTINEREQYLEWVKSLQVGEKVAVQYRMGTSYHHRFLWIAKITPKRQIVLNDGSRFNGMTGRARGEYYMDSNAKIVKVTNEMISNKIKNRIVKDLSNTKWSQVDIEKLMEIEKILG